MNAALAAVDTAALDCLDEHGCPDLQTLVRRSGGCDKITAEVWTQFDADIAAWHKRRRVINASVTAPSVTKTPSRRSCASFEECAACFARGTFGYRKQTLSRIGQLTTAAAVEPGVMVWFCHRHMPARFFADARRDP
jgi:hypothetical protein